MPLINGYYYPVVSNGTVVNGPTYGSGGGGTTTVYSSGSAYPAGTANAPAISIGTGSGIYQSGVNMFDVAVSGTTMLHIDPGAVPYTAIVQLTGPFYTDGTSPMLQLGSGSWGCGLISFPNGLHIRSNDGYLDHYLIARSCYTSGQISGSEDSFQTLVGSVQAGTGKSFRWWNRSRIVDGGDGIIQLTNNASSSFNRLMFGGSSSLSCSLVVAGTTLKVRNGIDTGDANLTAGNFTAAGSVTAASATVSTLTASYMSSSNVNATVVSASTLLVGGTVNFNAVNAATGNFGTINFTASGTAGTYTDLTASSITTQKIVSPVYNNTGLGSNDFVSAISGTYVFCDFMGDKSVNGSGIGNGYVINAITTPGSVNTYPAGITQAAMANHPGVEFVQVQNVGDVAAVSTSPLTTTLNAGFVCNALTTYTLQHIFYTPSVSSTAGERYTLSVGSLAVTTTQIFGGLYIEYSDNLNGGNWVVCENGNINSGGRQVIVNSSVPFTTSTWNKLLIQQNGTNITASLNGVPLGAGASTVMKQTAPANNVAMAIGGMRMSKSTTTTSASIVAALDYSSCLSNMPR